MKRTNHTLSQLLVIHSRSLPNFLAFARPWWHGEHARATEVLADIVADQNDIATRAGQLIEESGGVAVPGRYPDRFSTLHDLSFNYMVVELLQFQNRTIASIERFIERLPPGSAAQQLAQEALGKAKAHLDALTELQRDAARTAGP